MKVKVYVNMIILVYIDIIENENICIYDVDVSWFILVFLLGYVFVISN